MAMIVKRDYYLQQLISSKSNNLIKIVTGIRRSGKSFLLFNLFHNHLIEAGVSEDHIIEIALDDRLNKNLRDPDDDKREQECASLKKIDDSFKKIIIMRDDIKPYHDNNGFYIVGLMDFLLKPDLIEQL